MEAYGETYQRELERARGEVLTAREVRASADVNRTFERFQSIVEDLQKAGAPLVARGLTKIGAANYSMALTIGECEYAVAFMNDSIRVFWRGRDKTPMIYDSLSSSRMHALGRALIEKCVQASLSGESHPGAQRPRVVKLQNN